MKLEDLLAIIGAFGGGTIALIAFSPIGRAIGDRIRGKHTNAEGMANELAEHRDETRVQIATLQEQVGELAERLDFAERMLSKQKEGERLAPPR